MDKNQFDEDLEDLNEDPLDQAFVAEDLEDLGLDQSNSKQEPFLGSKNSLLSSIKIKPDEPHQVHVEEEPTFENMKQWSNQDMGKLEQMIKTDLKKTKGKEKSQHGGSKNFQPVPSSNSIKFTKSHKGGHY